MENKISCLRIVFFCYLKQVNGKLLLDSFSMDYKNLNCNVCDLIFFLFVCVCGGQRINSLLH